MGTMTRREFVTRAGKYGSGAATSAMLALGLLAKTGAAGAQEASPGGGPGEGRSGAPGKGRRVLILGAGLCGMSAAYELGKLGYTCELLEARSRPGGRCWTVRGGTRETEVGGPEQIAGFPEGFYMNAGPARIPGHHTSTLGYCKEFGVPVEVFNNVNESAYYQVKNVGRVRMREARADLRGYVDELLAKAVNHDAVDRPLTADDKDALIEFLRDDGGLNPDLVYKPASSRGPSLNRTSESRGYVYDDLPAGAGIPGHRAHVLFHGLAHAGLARRGALVDDAIEQRGIDRGPAHRRHVLAWLGERQVARGVEPGVARPGCARPSDRSPRRPCRRPRNACRRSRRRYSWRRSLRSAPAG